MLLLLLFAVDVAACRGVLVAAVLLIDSCPRVLLRQRSEDPILTGRIDDCIEGRAMVWFFDLLNSWRIRGDCSLREWKSRERFDELKTSWKNEEAWSTLCQTLIDCALRCCPKKLTILLRSLDINSKKILAWEGAKENDEAAAQEIVSKQTSSTYCLMWHNAMVLDLHTSLLSFVL